MTKIAIVCGYGNTLNENIKNYINSVVDYVTQEHLSTLILSGGYTCNDQISEAKLMAQLISDRTDQVNLVLEEEAMTTVHNLLYANKILVNWTEPVEELYIFCDRVKYTKVYWLSRLIFSDRVVKIIKFYGKTENLFVDLIQIPSTLIQGLAVIFPKIDKKILVLKQKWLNKYK